MSVRPQVGRPKRCRRELSRSKIEPDGAHAGFTCLGRMHTQPVKITQKIKLKQFDPGYHAGLEKDKTKEKTAELAGRIGELQELLYANQQQSVLLLSQGMDASGKDGAV